jgi:hypothetical protein
VKEIKGVIEFVCEGGTGSSAKVCVELRTEFPGIGGTIITHEAVACALREEYSPSPKSAHRLFLRHTILKKLEDYFHRTGKYVFAHIPRPLGSISKVGRNHQEAYIYEWAFGSEGFPWVYFDRDANRLPITLHDWDKFAMSFHSAGIDVQMDTSDPEDGRISKNIIHQYPRPMADGTEMSSLWKRIDFGYESLKIDTERFHQFLHDKREDVERVLRPERYHLLVLASEYLATKLEMTETDIGLLESHVGDYRRSSLAHHISRGFGVGETVEVHIGRGTESLM